MQPLSNKIGNVEFAQAMDNDKTPEIDLMMGFERAGVSSLSPISLNLHHFPRRTPHPHLRWILVRFVLFQPLLFLFL